MSECKIEASLIQTVIKGCLTIMSGQVLVTWIARHSKNQFMFTYSSDSFPKAHMNGLTRVSCVIQAMMSEEAIDALIDVTIKSEGLH